MQIPHDGLVLVADGAKMLLLRNEGDATHPNLVVESAEQQADPADRDIKSDDAGRAPGGPLPGGSAHGEADFHQQAEDRFAAEAAALLNRRALADGFETLVVVAPPKTLGELRKHYSKQLEAKITGELAKDLVSHPVDRIEEALLAA